VASYLAQKSLCKGCALRPVQSSVSTCLALKKGKKINLVAPLLPVQERPPRRLVHLRRRRRHELQDGVRRAREHEVVTG
jgi:hypothetical protein